MNRRPQRPHITPLRIPRLLDLRAIIRLRPTTIPPRLQRREAEISKHDVRVGGGVGEVAQEDVVGLDVAVDDGLPVVGR